MTNQVKVLLGFFGLLNKLNVYIKIERSNLNILIIILTNVMFYIALQLACPFVGLCFGHTMSMVAQHVTNYFLCKIFKGSLRLAKQYCKNK
jgi:hypothetical protein